MRILSTARAAWRPMLPLLSIMLAAQLAAPHAATAQSGGTGGEGVAAARPLFPARATPAGLAAPPSSSFFEVDAAAFEAFDPKPGEELLLQGIPLPGGGRAAARVERFTLLDGDARVLVDDRTPLAPPRHLLLTGALDGEPGSRVYLAVFRDALFGLVRRASGARAVFAPVGPGNAVCAVTAEADMPRRTPPPECHAEQLEQYRDALRRMQPPPFDAALNLPAATPGGPATQSTATRLNLALDCDYNYYQLNGSNLTAATNYAIALMGGVTDIYRRDANIVWSLSYLNVWTTVGPYPGPAADSLLAQLRRNWIANHALFPRAVVQLLHGSGIGGLAYVDILCNNNWGYSVSGVDGVYFFPPSGYIWDLDVVSHELGHNVGSPHTHNCWWNPAVDSCVSAEGGNCYSTPNVIHGTIMSYCHITSGGTELMFHPRVAPYLKTRADAAACRQSQSVPDVDAGPTRAVCSGAAAQIGNPATSGTPPYTYLWWPAATLSSATVAQPLATPSGPTLYHVRATDANGYRAYDSVLVIIAQAPVAEAGQDRTYCSGPGVAIGGAPTARNGTPPYAYAWSPAMGLGSTTAANPLAAPARATLYHLLVTDASGCTARDSVWVQTAAPPVADAGRDTTICNGTSTLIGNPASGGQPPYTYAWTPATGLNDPAAESPAASPTVTTWYTVTVTDANGCSGSDDVLVTVITQPNASLTWTGAVNTDWSTRGNWDQPCALPGNGSQITIPPGTTSPENVPSISLGGLMLNNGLTLELRQAVTVTGALELRSGSILLDATDLIVGPAGSIAGGDSTNFIVTANGGNLRQAGLGAGGRTGTVLFPVGPAASTYAPVRIANGGAADIFAVRVETPARTRGGAGTPLAADVVNLVWQVDEALPGGSSVNLTLQWNAADELPAFDRGRCYLARFNGFDWLPQSSPGSATGSNPYQRGAAGVIYLGSFGVGDLQSLYPVTLLSLSAVLLDRSVLLLWNTADERNNAGFGVERRAASDAWTTIGSVPASGSERGAQYRFEDTAPPDGRVAYRLRQTDVDGRQSWSQEVAVDRSAPGGRGAAPAAASLFVAPHPVARDAVIAVDLAAGGPVTLDLWDTLGRRVALVLDAAELRAGSHLVAFPRGDLPAGSYVLRLTGAAGTVVRTVVLQ